MKDKEWCKTIEAEITDLKNRVSKLEGNLANEPENSSSCSEQKTLEGDIEWPEADIGGLHFNAVKTHAVFEKIDGIYYSRDILFHSARDTDEGTGRDLLSDYLASDAVRLAIKKAFNISENVYVYLPKTNQGVKKYNGVSWWYWLKPRSSGSSAGFTYVHDYGISTDYSASAVGGCAPAFCVGGNRHG